MINQECDSVEKKINSHRQFAADRFISSDKRFTFRTSKEYIPVYNDYTYDIFKISQISNLFFFTKLYFAIFNSGSQ